MQAKTLPDIFNYPDILIYLIIQNALSVSPMAITFKKKSPSPNEYLLITSIIRWLVKIQNERETLQTLVSSKTDSLFDFIQ